MKYESMFGNRLLPLLVLVLSAGMAISTPAYAGEVQDLDNQVERIDKASKETGIAQPDLEAVSKATGVPVTELRRQQGKTQMGTGSLLIANSLATKTGKSFDEIMAAKASGKGWGDIAKDSDVKLGPLLKEAKQVSRVQARNGATNSKAAKAASDEVSQGKKATNQSAESKGSSNQAKGQGAGGKYGDGGGKDKR
jgi:hypothetical protein